MPGSAYSGMDVLRTYGEGFAGREAELVALDRAWTRGARVFVLHAEGGAGKTRVVSQWLTRMRDANWRGARRLLVHSFYSQGSDERRNASSELFFEQALSHFGHSGPRCTDPAEQGRILARLMVEQQGLLVLDGLEPLQHPPTFDRGRLKDPALHSFLLSLAIGETGPLSDSRTGGLCVVTSRQPIVELQDKIGRTVVQQPLDRLDPAAGAQLLRQLEVRGSESELRQAAEDARGHAYSLMLLGSYLRDATADHEIRRRHEIPLLEEDAEHRYHARHLFGAYVRHLGESSPEIAVLRLLGFFDRPAEEELLAVLREAAEPELDALTGPLRKLAPAEWRRLLRRLKDLRLIDLPVSPSPPLDSHPLLREYFAEQLRSRFLRAWQTGHRRLFEHLCGRAEHQPASMTGLQPLYQAVAHGCLAELHQQACDDVYRDRILRGTGADGFYSTRRLGAIGADLGAIASFFVLPWKTLSANLKPQTQAWLLQEAAYRLRALGRLAEAVDPMRAGIGMAVEQEDWEYAAIYSSNLSGLEMLLGEMSAAVATGEQAVYYADRSGEEDWQNFIRSRKTLADALHQAGRHEDSRCLFSEAQSRQDRFRPEYSRLFSAQDFPYFNLLLADAERAAWRSFLSVPAGGSGGTSTACAAACDAVIELSSQSLVWSAPQHWLLDIAQDHLVLARALLYKAVHSAAPVPPAVPDHLAEAIKGFRAASTMDHLPGGLLTQAWLRCLSGDEPGGRADLDEAWEIAERGPMPLFQADILLTRARLFRDRAALAEARRLIEKHGYHRRDEELADTQAAAERWALLAQPSGTERAELDANEHPKRDQVFISYSHSDAKFLKEFLTHLKPYLRSDAVKAWSDRQIAAGATWLSEIQEALSKTGVAVLLVSPDFLASEFIHEHELGPLLQGAEAGGVTILWVQLRACAFEETPLAAFQAVVSPPEKPLAEKSRGERDRAWVRVCQAIKSAVAKRTLH